MILMCFALILISLSSYGQYNNSTDCFSYPAKVVKFDLRDNYDNARWILFNWLGAETLDDVYYGQMELIYKDVIHRNDTVFIDFGFYESDKSLKSKKKLKLVAKTTVAFRQRTNECIWAFVYPFIAPSRGLNFGDNLLEMRLTDTTHNYLKAQRNIINECFVELALKKKIID